jgi:cyclophilin family peptidyl-prolyl cis-trans isomerase
MPTTNVVVETNQGSFTLALDSERAPKTVENFLQYVDSNHYAGTVFHRVIPGFMVQGGGYDTSWQKKPTLPAVSNEADNGVKNLRGTVAMARTGDPHSATSQFFVNLVANAFLDHKGKTDRDWGYTVFGTVIAGTDVVDRIAAIPTGAQGPFPKDAPMQQVTILSVRRAPA